MYPLKVIVIGAGIGGLTCAIACRCAGYDVEVYDRVEKLQPSGGGIILWPNGVKALKVLGLNDSIAAIAGYINYLENRNQQDRLLSSIDLRLLTTKVGQRPYPVSRWNLQQILLDTFGLNNVRFGSRCINVEQNSRSVTAFFENGTQATGDLLIGADGIHSRIRSYVSEKEVRLRYANYVNWNGLIPACQELFALDKWSIYVGDCKRVSIMPVGDDYFSFIFGAPMPKGTIVNPEQEAELLKIFTGWQKVTQLIGRLAGHKINRIEIQDFDPLESLVKGRIALLGDAGHASTPALGQGACQAIEDAVVVARCLVKNKISVGDALKQYESERKKRTAVLTLKARTRTDLVYGKDPKLTQKWYSYLKNRKEKEVIDSMAKISLSGPFS